MDAARGFRSRQNDLQTHQCLTKKVEWGEGGWVGWFGQNMV